MGKDAPSATVLANSIAPQIREQLGKLGLPEAQLDPTVANIIAGLIANASFNAELLPLVQQLSSLDNNPWLKHINTDAQGYSRVTLTAQHVDCQFRQVNRLVDTLAPSVIVANTTQVMVAADSIMPIIS